MRRARCLIAGSTEPPKKRPRWLLRAATEADQPGMGMTNRVIPAQGEERGASFTLMSLDGDTPGKFQGQRAHFAKFAKSLCQASNRPKTAKTAKTADIFAFPTIS